MEKAHAELWKRFVDEHNLILDYVGLDGGIVRPTPEGGEKGTGVILKA